MESHPEQEPTWGLSSQGCSCLDSVFRRGQGQPKEVKRCRMRSQPAVQLLREGTEPSAQPHPACEALCRPQHGPGRAQDELQPVLNSQRAPKQPARSIMGSQDWKNSYKKRLSGPWHKPFIPQSLQSRALAAKSAGRSIPSSAVHLGVCPTCHTTSAPFICKGRQLKSRKSQGAFGKKGKTSLRWHLQRKYF